MPHVLLLLLLLTLTFHQAQPLVQNFHAVFTAENGFGGNVPTAWEVLHGMGLGGKTKLTVEGLHIDPPDAKIFLTLVDHNSWHTWFRWITQVPRDSPTRWQRSMLVCSAPSKIRLALENNTTHSHLDFQDNYIVGMNGDETPIEIDFFAYGRYTVLLVSCRGNDNAAQRVDVSGRVQMVTEAPSQVPNLFGTSSTLTQEEEEEGIEPENQLSHLGYGENIYPLLWSVVVAFYALLLVQWSYVLLRQRPLLWRRSRVVDSRLLVVALGSVACKLIEAALKLQHYRRLSLGLLYMSGYPFAAAIMEAASSSLLLLLLGLGALGITIVRIDVYMREAMVLSGVLSVHFITALSQAFCRESASPTAAVPPSSSSSISYIVSNPDHHDIDQYYLDSESCEVLVFSEYVVQALVMLAIIIALNYNIAKLRQHITGVTWSRLSHHLYDKLECFHIFRKLFMLYLLAPTLLLVVQIMILTWRYNWLMALMVETTNIIIYYNIGLAIFTTGSNPFASVPIVLNQQRIEENRQLQQEAAREEAEAGQAAGGGGGGSVGGGGGMSWEEQSRMEEEAWEEEEARAAATLNEETKNGGEHASEKNSEGEERTQAARTNTSDVVEIDMDW